MGYPKVILTTLTGFLIVSCTQDQGSLKDVNAPMGREEARRSANGKLFGADFLLFGGPRHNHASNVANLAPSVNGYLWQASLDILSFTPLAAADSKGGIIVSDWYTAPHAPNERIKVTVYITSQQLRADALKVSIHKQLRHKNGDWINAMTDPNVAIELENLILSQARELRVKSSN